MSKDSKLIEEIDRISRFNSLLGHPLRLAIIKDIYEHDEVSWSEIVEYLESIFGKLNPNTVNFHLTKLVLEKIVVKEGDIYRISEEIKEMDLFKTIMKMMQIGV